MIQFFYAPGSCSLASHLALEFSGADYEAIRVNLREMEQRQQKYLSINPKGRVPVLVTENNVITENPAILLYVAQKYPKAQLAPLDDADALSQVNSFNAYMSSTVHVAHAHGARPYRWADDEAAMAEMKRKMPEVMTDCFAMIENEMFKGPWVIGEQFTISDLYLFTISRWLESDGVDASQFPNVCDHRQRMNEHEVVTRVLDAQ